MCLELMGSVLWGEGAVQSISVPSDDGKATCNVSGIVEKAEDCTGPWICQRKVLQFCFMGKLGLPCLFTDMSGCFSDLQCTVRTTMLKTLYRKGYAGFSAKFMDLTHYGARQV